MSDPEFKIKIKNLCFSYGPKSVFSGIRAAFQAHRITAISGPSGQGKSTLLSVFNRLWEEIPAAKVRGEVKIELDGSWVDVNNGRYPVHRLRRKVAMVFQDPNPLPMSVTRNVAFPLRLAGEKDKALVEARVCRALQQAFLWDEVKDRLNADARILSGGQQQRLCIARALVMDPEILLLDEPTASLDTKACGVIEDLLLALKARCTILMVSHYMDQVRRVADCTVQLADGRLIADTGDSECIV